MNRIIKFRVWDKLDEQMVPWEECEDTELLRDAFKGKDAVAMQFTGLKDKEEREIYEGDILEYDAYRHGGYSYAPYKGKVEWGKGGYWLTSNHDFNNSQSHKVIGNIFENPELCMK